MALFSVSVTAGTTYLVYTAIKMSMIKKLVALWAYLGQKENGTQLDQLALRKRLEVLYVWDVKLLLRLYETFVSQGANSKETQALKLKVTQRKIPLQLKEDSIDTLLQKYILKPVTHEIL